jgi:urease accessory protein
MTLKRILGAAALLLTPAIAFAHPGHGDSGLIAGISHPIGGLDHLLAMLAVGLWAAQQKGAARWALPCTFVGTMLIGGLLGFEGLELPALESGIAASVLALGLAVALAVRPPLSVAVGATALFALFHGVAHGLELPDMSSPWAYAQGSWRRRRYCMRLVMRWCVCCQQAAAPLVRLAGAASAATGVWLFGG